MKRAKKYSKTSLESDIEPARSPDEWENRCIGAAYRLVEKRLMEGTATSAETVHFLKLGSSKEKLERALTEKQIELAAAKADAYKSTKVMEELYANALTAMRTYTGQETEDG